jgi:hypothetical protein
MEPNNQLEPQQPSRSRWLWISGGFLLVVFLGLAAYFAGQFMAGNVAGPGPDTGLGPVLQGGPNGGGERVEVSAENQPDPAPELPTTQPDANGLFLRRDGNSIYIGTGGVSFSVGPEGPASSNDGPEVEVVVTGDTLVYKDVTMTIDSENPPEPGGDMPDQQVVESGSIDDLTAQSMLTVWGEKRGDRLVATVVVYSEPIMVIRP